MEAANNNAVKWSNNNYGTFSTYGMQARTQ